MSRIVILQYLRFNLHIYIFFVRVAYDPNKPLRFLADLHLLTFHYSRNDFIS